MGFWWLAEIGRQELIAHIHDSWDVHDIPHGEEFLRREYHFTESVRAVKAANPPFLSHSQIFNKDITNFPSIYFISRSILDISEGIDSCDVMCGEKEENVRGA